MCECPPQCKICSRGGNGFKTCPSRLAPAPAARYLYKAQSDNTPSDAASLLAEGDGEVSDCAVSGSKAIFFTSLETGVLRLALNEVGTNSKSAEAQRWGMNRSAALGKAPP